MTKAIGVLCGWLCVAPCAAQRAGGGELDTAAITAAVQAEMAALGAPGVSVAVVQNGAVVYARGFGVRSSEGGEPVTPETLFRIGSVSKVFTALGVLALADSGVLDLRAPVARYLPGLAPALGRRTLHELLNHTAGLVNLGAANGARDESALRARVLAWGDDVLFAEPGEIYSYSSPGYWLAGAVAAEVAGKPFADVIAERVLTPLGMTRSTFRPQLAFTYPIALDHQPGPEGARVARPFPDDASTWPGGSLFSSAAELARLALALTDTSAATLPLPRAVLRAVMTPQAPSLDSVCAYTYGLSRCTAATHTSLGHYGFRSGSGAVFTVVPEQRLGIIVLSNIAFGILGATEAAILAAAGVPSPPSSAPAVRDLTAAERRALRGRYAAGRDTLHFEIADGKLRYRYGPQSHGVRTDASVPGSAVIVNEGGEPVQHFRLVRGAGAGRWFLTDGLNAFRRLDGPGG